METSLLKNWLCPNFLLLTKICPKFAQNLGGAAFPLAPRPVRLCAPWITKELISLCKEERSLYKPRRSNKTTIWEKHQRVSEQFCKDTLQNSSMGIH